MTTLKRRIRDESATARLRLYVKVTGDKLPTSIDHSLDHWLRRGKALLQASDCTMTKLRPEGAKTGKTTLHDTYSFEVPSATVDINVSALLSYEIDESDSATRESIEKMLQRIRQQVVVGIRDGWAAYELNELFRRDDLDSLIDYVINGDPNSIFGDGLFGAMSYPRSFVGIGLGDPSASMGVGFGSLGDILDDSIVIDVIPMGSSREWAEVPDLLARGFRFAENFATEDLLPGFTPTTVEELMDSLRNRASEFSQRRRDFAARESGRTDQD